VTALEGFRVIYHMGANSSTETTSRKELLWYLPGFLLLLVANGRIVLPLAAWIAPVFILRASRRSPAPLGLPIGFAGYAGAVTLSWTGMVPIAWLTPLIGLFGFLPFFVDRLLFKRLSPAASTLTYPAAIVVMELVNSLFNPMGTWGAVAYTQYGFPAIMQLASVGGTALVSFLVSWAASVLEGLWQRGFGSAPDRALAIGLVVVVLVASVWGTLRIHHIARLEGTLSVASVTTESNPRQAWMEMYLLKESGQWGDLENLMDAANARAFQQVEELAGSGAAVVMTHETAFAATSNTEAKLMEEASRAARASGTWFVLSFQVVDPEGRNENRVRVLSPRGESVAEQYKFGGAVFEGFSKVGDGDPAAFTVDGTRVGTYICWDLDFGRTIRRLRRFAVDVLLVPAADWRAIDPMHPRMAVFRAVENGVSLVRQTAEGLSLVTDPAGTTLAAMDHFTADRLRMVAEVPARGVKTLYSVIGDLAAWLSLAVLCLLIALAIRQKTREQRSL
jgi:apolipoprotein N-acyltransferase